MRLSVALGCLLLGGCTGPHSSGALWAQRLVEQETVLFRLGDAQRADRVRAVVLGLADETIAAERARVESGLSACPGVDRQALAVSVGDRARDIVRIHAADDPARMRSLAQIALADWYTRRARSTGIVRFCAEARQALVQAISGQEAAVSGGDALGLQRGFGMATVTRDPGRAVATAETFLVSLALSNYALGYVDTVQAMAPLPQYLAAVYGGVVVDAKPALIGGTPESLVDGFAPAYPDWEPDALYAAFSIAK